MKKQIIFKSVPVVDLGTKGKGIAKTEDGKVVFLPQVVPGDVVDIQVLKKRRKYFEGKAIHFHEYSKKRVSPVCEHFGICGGCKWQHIDYDYQLELKQQKILDNLRRIGELTIETVLPIKANARKFLYRNKLEFSFSNNRWLSKDEISSKDTLDKKACGFHVAGMWDKVVPITNCHLQEEPSNQIRNFIVTWSKQNNISFYDSKKKEGFLRNMLIRTSSLNECMVVVQFFEEDMETITLLMDAIGKEFPLLNSLQYVINTKGNDTIYDQEVILHKGKNYIQEQMEDLTFKIDAKSFYQTNSDQAYELYKIVRDFAELKGTEKVYDLYTGIGTIAQFIAKDCKEVVGIESVPEAVKNAKESAKFNNCTNASFYTGDMKTKFTSEFIGSHGKPDLIITDPPRDGMHKKVVEQLLENEIPRIIYVSCNSATQARDLALLKDKYKVVKSQAVDMFPQTFHTENVVLLALR